MYAETKFLLFTIFKALPESQVNSSFESTLNAAWKYAKDYNDKVITESALQIDDSATLHFCRRLLQNLQDKIKRIQKNTADLIKVGYLKENDNYAQLRKDAVQVGLLMPHLV